MLRIVRSIGPAGNPVLSLEGKLLAPWVDEVREQHAQTLPSEGNVQLDLSAVSFADRAGLQLLRDLIHGGAQIASCSGYLAESLRLEAHP